MSLALCFAILMLLRLLSFFWKPPGAPWASNVLDVAMLFVLGWAVFGPLIQG